MKTYSSAGVIPYVHVKGKGIFFLLGKESKGSKRGKWGSFSGMIDPGENRKNPISAAKREFKEETMGIFNGFYDDFKYEHSYDLGTFRGYFVDLTPFFMKKIGPSNEPLKMRALKSFLLSYNNLYTFMSKTNALKSSLNKHGFWEKSEMRLFTMRDVLKRPDIYGGHRAGMKLLLPTNKVLDTKYALFFREIQHGMGIKNQIRDTQKMMEQTVKILLNSRYI